MADRHKDSTYIECLKRENLIFAIVTLDIGIYNWKVMVS